MPPPRANSEDLPGQGPRKPEDLAQLRMFRGVEQRHLEAAFAAIEQRRVRTRASLRLDQEFKNRVGFVWGGAFRFCAAAPGGEIATLYSIAAPHGFGYAMANAGYGFGDVHRLVADRGGALLALAAPIFCDLAQKSQPLANNLNKALTHLTLLYGARLYEFAASSVRGRLICELLRRGDQSPSKSDRRPLMPSPTHAALADLIGATREAVSRHLRSLADEGAIDLDRRRITIVSMRALRALDQRTLGNRFTRPAGE